MRRRSRCFVPWFVAGLLVSAVAAAQPPSPLVNPDFEAGDSLGVPQGWRLGRVTREEGYEPAMHDTGAASGRRWASLRATRPGMGFGVIVQRFDARPWRGKRVVWTARIRWEPTELSAMPGQAALWVRVDRASRQPGFFDNMGDRPVQSSAWTPVAIVGTVDADAETLNVGLLVQRSGRGGIDAVRMEAVPEAPSRPDPARPLSARGLANLVALARVMGYVRYFHPSDQAAELDWDRFTLDAVPVVERAKDARELAATLRRFFAPVAPAVTIAAGSVPARFDTAGPPPGAVAFRAWRRHGYAVPGTPGTYSSERIRRRLSARGAERDVPLVGSFTAVDLGGGVWCRVPHTVWADSAGTLPVPATAFAFEPRPEYWQPSGDERTVRLADVMLLWNVLQHFYPYWDVVGGDWPAALRGGLEAAARDKDGRAFQHTLDGMLARIHDGHGGVYSGGTSFQARPFSWAWAEGRLVVDAVRDSLAPGLHVGDEVMRVGGRALADEVADARAHISAAGEGWFRWRALARLQQSSPGDTLELEVRDAAGQVRTLRIGEDRSENPVKFARPDTITEIRPGIWYVDMDRVRTEQLAAKLDEIAKARGVVFDLRGYPSNLAPGFLGNLTDSTLTSARWNVPNVPYPDARERTFEFSNWPIQAAKPRITGRVAFVIDGRAISYAETCMGIVEHYRLGELVGEPTAGTNGNIVRLTLPGKYTIIFTGMRVLKHDGSRHHGVGIRPTVPVSRTVAGIRAGRDELLERAIDVVSAAR